MRYKFGDCVLDTTRREFQHDEAQVHLSPKAYELLHLLIEQRPRVVSKQELMQALWPDTYVVEGNLPVIVAEVRSAIGPREVAASVIKTHHRIGYSFAVDVEESSSGSKPRGAGTRMLLKIGARRIELGPGVNEVGRDAECDVRINDVSVSRAHARITLTGTVATIVDLSSKNGTQVNGTIVDAPIELKDGDELKFGQIEAQFVVARRRDSASTATL